MLNQMVHDCPLPEDSVRGDPSRELATIHSICELHKEEVLNLSHQARVSETDTKIVGHYQLTADSLQPTLKKLVFVTDHLSRYKKRCSEASKT